MHAYAPYVHTYMYEPYVHTYMYEIVYIHMTHVTRINFVHVCVYIYIYYYDIMLCFFFIFAHARPAPTHRCLPIRRSKINGKVSYQKNRFSITDKVTYDDAFHYCSSIYINLLILWFIGFFFCSKLSYQVAVGRQHLEHECRTWIAPTKAIKLCPLVTSLGRLSIQERHVHFFGENRNP